eukprot:2754451-Lingulodinium_polyedra.AAC.1
MARGTPPPAPRQRTQRPSRAIVRQGRAAGGATGQGAASGRRRAAPGPFRSCRQTSRRRTGGGALPGRGSH